MKYKKPLGATILSLLTCLALTLGAAASEWEEVTLRAPSQSALPAARLIEGTTYVPFRAFCDAWGADGQIEWEGDSRTARYRGTGLEISAAIGQCYLQANGRVLCRGKENLLLDDRTYVPIRALADAFTLQVEWQDEGIGSRSVTLTGSPRAIENAETAYDGEDLLWLSRVISAEAEGESFEGKLAVGSVVMNRVNARGGEYARVGQGSIRNIIFQPYQFVCASETESGAYNPQNIYNMRPEQIHYDIADWAIAGNRLPDVAESLWFYNPFGPQCRSRFPSDVGYWQTRIGDHCFYNPTNAYYQT